MAKQPEPEHLQRARKLCEELEGRVKKEIGDEDGPYHDLPTFIEIDERGAFVSFTVRIRKESKKEKHHGLMNVHRYD